MTAAWPIKWATRPQESGMTAAECLRRMAYDDRHRIVETRGNYEVRHLPGDWIDAAALPMCRVEEMVQ